MTHPSPEAVECTCPKHGSWYGAASIDKLVREIDVAMNGEDGAAKQALLCDVVGQVLEQARAVTALTSKSDDLQARLKDVSAQLEAERSRQAEAEAEANEVGIRYGFANAQTEIADLNDRLTRETARADAAEKEAKALREASEWRPRSEYDPNVHPKSFLVQYASGLIVMGRWVDNSDRAWPWKGILPAANTPTAADDRLLYWRPLPEARATLVQPADGGK